ncbi:MAG TPA: transcriptional regulator NrdR [Candidatus Saccharimonadales bacterium]
MKCPKCQAVEAKVVESRDVSGGEATRRRRECLKCGTRYTTYERIERPNLVVVKRDGNRESFDRSKILAGIDKAAEKTSISAHDRAQIVSKIEKKVYETGEAEVPSTLIGELVMSELAKLDDVAYVRFASVYRHFTSIKGFERELSKMKERAEKVA